MLYIAHFKKIKKTVCLVSYLSVGLALSVKVKESTSSRVLAMVDFLSFAHIAFMDCQKGHNKFIN